MAEGVGNARPPAAAPGGFREGESKPEIRSEDRMNGMNKMEEDKSEA